MVLCSLLYKSALGAPLFFDDLPNLVDNSLVQISGHAFDGWRAAALSSSAGAIERPVAMLTFALNYVVVGELSPVALKATNLLIHFACAGLIFLFATQLIQSPALRIKTRSGSPLGWIPMLAALLWLLHPLHVSTVMYSVQRMAQFSTLFTLAGFVLYLHYRLQWARQKTEAATIRLQVLPVLLWLALLGGLAVLSKENGALLPWLLIVTEVTLFKSVWCGRRSPIMACAAWALLILPLLVLGLLLLVSPDTVLDRYATREFTLSERLQTQGRVLWHYVAWTFFPSLAQLGFFHDDISISRGFLQPVTTLISLLAWIAVLVMALFLRSRFPILLFSLLFFLVAHSMESSVVPLEMVFEHRNYLPTVGLAIFSAYVLIQAGVGLRSVASSFSVFVPGVAALLVLCVLLGTRAYMWRDDFSFAQFNVVNHPESPRANFYYANVLYEKFLHAQGEGSVQEERAALAISARQYYLNMHRLDSRDMAPLVMLYQLDSKHFPVLAVQNDWLFKIETLASSRRLQRSDITAIAAMVKHVLESDSGDRERIDALLSQLRDRDPNKLALLALQFRLLKDQPGRRAEVGRMLEEYAQRKPNSRKAAAYLAQFYGSGGAEGSDGAEGSGKNTPATYTAIASWLANDRDWQEISAIREVFN